MVEKASTSRHGEIFVNFRSSSSSYCCLHHLPDVGQGEDGDVEVDVEGVRPLGAGAQLLRVHRRDLECVIVCLGIGCQSNREPFYRVGGQSQMVFEQSL